jgi:hypothetical protein
MAKVVKKAKKAQMGLLMGLGKPMAKKMTNLRGSLGNAMGLPGKPIIKKGGKIKKAQRGSVSCPRPFKSDAPGFIQRLRDRIQEGVENRQERRQERRDARKEAREVKANPYRGALGKPNDRPLALDYTKPSREGRSYDLLGGNAQAKKGKKVTKKYKAGGKIKPAAKKSIVKPKTVKKKK